MVSDHEFVVLSIKKSYCVITNCTGAVAQLLGASLVTRRYWKPGPAADSEKLGTTC